MLWELGRPITVGGRPIDPNSAFQLQGHVTDVQVEHIIERLYSTYVCILRTGMYTTYRYVRRTLYVVHCTSYIVRTAGTCHVIIERLYMYMLPHTGGTCH